MQDLSAISCKQSANTPTTRYKLIDRRGSTYYAYLVAKIVNRCWMVQNMALPGGTTYAGTYSNTANASTGVTLPASSNSTSNYYSSVSANTTKSMYNGTHIGKGDTNGNITETPAADNTSTNTGAYYTWEVATAGTGSGKTTQYQNTVYSICPRGWRLPSFNNSDGATAVGGDFGALTGLTAWSSYNKDALTNSGFASFGNAYTSYCTNTGCPLSGALGSYSFWWSSTVSSSSAAYDLRAYSSSGLYATNYHRAFGFQVRCVIGG